jgi:tetratricopeptide (TPR) repeat protein
MLGGKIEQAAATLNRAVEIAVSKNDRPGAFWSYFARASLHLEQGNRDQALADFAEAKKAFAESLALNPVLDIWGALMIAVTNGHLGNHEQARQQYATALELIERRPIDKNQTLRRLRDEAQRLLETSPKAKEDKTND